MNRILYFLKTCRVEIRIFMRNICFDSMKWFTRQFCNYFDVDRYYLNPFMFNEKRLTSKSAVSYEMMI